MGWGRNICKMRGLCRKNRDTDGEAASWFWQRRTWVDTLFFLMLCWCLKVPTQVCISDPGIEIVNTAIVVCLPLHADFTILLSVPKPCMLSLGTPWEPAC